MSNWSEQQIELKIQKGIRQFEDDLVIAIEKALNTAEYPKQGKDKLEAAQFRNLMHVADTTDSNRVIENFLHYQLGRDKKWGTGKNSLAEVIITDINNLLHQKAKEIVKQAFKEINHKNQKANQRSSLKDKNRADEVNHGETKEDLDVDKKITQEELDNKVKEKIKTVWIELTRRYLGYGSRHLRYLDTNEGEQKEATNNFKQENNVNTNTKLNSPNNPPKNRR